MTLNTVAKKPESAPVQQTSTSTGPSRLEKKTQHIIGNGIIEYLYYPKGWSKTQRVCGILGKDKWETIQFVKKGFPDLAEVDVDRFDFQVFNGRGNWITVLEEAWEVIGRDPPPIWIVIIKELPEEQEQRIQLKKRSNRRWITNLAASAVAISVSIIASLAGLADGTWSGYLKVGGITAAVHAVVHIAAGMGLAI